MLEQLRLPFRQIAPEIDETPLAGESVEDMVARLAVAKSKKVAGQIMPDRAVIIGSDQAASFRGGFVGKSGSATRAVEQLIMLSGQSLTFHTSLCVLDVESDRMLTAVEQTRVLFRKLSEDDIRHYVEVDNPINATGSFHAEGLGITLFETIESKDPSSLIGLPLIRLTQFLNRFGIGLQAMG